MGTNGYKGDIQRTKDVTTDNSEVEIYLNRDYLEVIIEEYNVLKSALLDWEAQTQANIQGIRDNSAGEASQTFVSKGEEFADINLQVMYDKLVVAIRVLCAASLMSKGMLLRCENFYEILQGGSEYLGYSLPNVGASAYMNGVTQTPICPELFLDKTYYGTDGGVIAADTEDVVGKFSNLMGEKETLERILNSLEVFKIDISQECANIQEDCEKKIRVDTLFGSFEKYVQEVSNFNITIYDSFMEIVDPGCAFDRLRKYEYPEYSSTKQNIVLQRALLGELHEMGYSEDTINRMLTKSGATLSTVAVDREAKLLKDAKEKSVIGNAAISFIPQNLSNRALIDFYESCRRNRDPYGLTARGALLGNTLSQQVIDDHYNENVNYFNNNPQLYVPGQYIENQNTWGDVQYGSGKSNMSYSGCEIIAVANALHSLGDDLSRDEMAGLIKYFEEDGMCINGNIGTSPMALKDYLDDNGYNTEYTLSTDVSEINEMGERYDTLIVTAYNDSDDITQEVHTVCITREENGGYVVHNGYKWKYDGQYYASQPYATLDDAINDIGSNKDSQSIMVMGINK